MTLKPSVEGLYAIWPGNGSGPNTAPGPLRGTRLLDEARAEPS